MGGFPDISMMHITACHLPVFYQLDQKQTIQFGIDWTTLIAKIILWGNSSISWAKENTTLTFRPIPLLLAEKTIGEQEAVVSVAHSRKPRNTGRAQTEPVLQRAAKRPCCLQISNRAESQPPAPPPNSLWWKSRSIQSLSPKVFLLPWLSRRTRWWTQRRTSRNSLIWSVRGRRLCWSLCWAVPTPLTVSYASLTGSFFYNLFIT